MNHRNGLRLTAAMLVAASSLGVASPGAFTTSASCSIAAIGLSASGGGDANESMVDADTIKDVVEAVVAAGKVLKKVFSEHPVEHWTGNELKLPVRDITDQKSRVSNNIDKSKFEKGVRVCRFRWAKGTVNADDAKRTRVTFMADKQARRDQPRSESVKAGELFVMATPTDADRNYYVGRLEAPGDSEGFTARNPGAMLVLEIVPERELNGVLLAEHVDFGGSGRYFPKGSRVTNLGSVNFNDATSSIRCFGDARLEAFEHADYGGARKTFTGTSKNIHVAGWGDRISSIAVK